MMLHLLYDDCVEMASLLQSSLKPALCICTATPNQLLDEILFFRILATFIVVVILPLLLIRHSIASHSQFLEDVRLALN